MNSFQLFTEYAKKIVQRTTAEYHHRSCVKPTVKNPKIIYVRGGCFSAKWVGSLTFLPKSITMNKD